MSVLEVENLHVGYRTRSGPIHALRGVSLAIEKGEVVGLVGESGSGKSTLAYAIVRHLGGRGVITQGTILFEGRDVLAMNQSELAQFRGGQVAMVFQDPHTALNPALTVGEQVAEVIMVHRGLTRQQAREETERLLGLVQLPAARFVMDKYPHQLSGGEKQRVLIATAFSCDPKLLILDEPTTALDATTAAEILELLGDLQRRFQTAALYITHDLGIVNRVSQQVHVIYAGQIVERGPTQDVLAHPHHPYTRSLVQSVPQPGATIHERRLPVLSGPFPDLRQPPLGCIFQERCPYAEQPCRQGDVLLKRVGDKHEAACVRLGEISAESLPLLTAKARPPEAAVPVLKAQNLRIWHRVSRSLEAFLPWRQPRYVRAVDDVSLEVPAGQTLGLVGESGCGKSTVARALLGLNPAQGAIALGEQVFSSPRKVDRAYRKRVQIVFQHPDSSLNPRKRVRDLIGRPLIRFGLASRQNVATQVRAILESVRLPASYAERYPHELSGGEKQRVAIARGLASQPDVIICDELTSGLDVSTQATIVNLLAELQEKLGLSYLFIAHDLNLVHYVSDRIAVMYMGQIVDTGSAQEMFQAPFHPYTEALLSAALIPDPNVEVRRVRLSGELPDPLNLPAGCRFHTRCPHKIGAICEETSPPLLDYGGGHLIACHIPLEALRELPPVWHTTKQR
ncbi:MAG: dipeptide ABC transporter ATP-binding protein [Anaerolineae bacterium]